MKRFIECTDEQREAVTVWFRSLIAAEDVLREGASMRHHAQFRLAEITKELGGPRAYRIGIEGGRVFVEDQPKPPAPKKVEKNK